MKTIILTGIDLTAGPKVKNYPSSGKGYRNSINFATFAKAMRKLRGWCSVGRISLALGLASGAVAWIASAVASEVDALTPRLVLAASIMIAAVSLCVSLITKR